jgi:hypothetical protein
VYTCYQSIDFCSYGVVSFYRRYKYQKRNDESKEKTMQFILCLISIFVLKQFVQAEDLSSQTESIIELYKKISEKGSLTEGLSLNDQAQSKLKTINTIRLLPLNYLTNNHSLLFNVSLNKIKQNEEIKLIEFRLKLKDKNRNFYRRKLILILRKRRIRPLIISTEQSEYLSYDLTDYLFHNSSHQRFLIRRQLWIINRLQQASLVIYSHAPGVFLLPTPNIRTKRSINQEKLTSPCSKHDLFVDFDQLSFGSWVVEPKRFNAGVCRGDCPNPLSRLYYPTNHAMLLSLLHERGSASQQPSCVPVRLRPLDLLYYDRRELVIKRHQGMQVEECGCR